MKKILIVANIVEHMGFHIKTIEYFQEKGFEVHIAAKMSQIRKVYENMGAICHDVRFSRSLFTLDHFKAKKDLDKIVSQHKFDLVHVHTPIAAFIARYVMKRNKVTNVLYTAHGFHFFKGAPIINWLVYYPLEKIAAYWTDGLITINKEDFERAKKLKLRGNGKIYKINGVGIDLSQYKNNKKLDKIKEELEISSEDFIILVLAEINRNKNHIQIIKAIEEVSNKHPHVKLLCAGEGPLKEELIDYVTKKKLDKNIKFLGWRNDIVGLIQISDVIGLFSKREGLPRCFLEGMYFEKPILATDTRGSREVVRDNFNGFVVPINDINETSKKVCYLVEKPKEKIIMGNNGKKVVEEYTVSFVMNQLDSIYKKYI